MASEKDNFPYLQIRVSPDTDCRTEEELLNWSDENLALTGDYEQTVAWPSEDDYKHYLIIGMRESVIIHREQVCLPKTLGAMAAELKCGWSILQKTILHNVGLPDSKDVTYHWLAIETMARNTFDMEQFADIVEAP